MGSRLWSRALLTLNNDQNGLAFSMLEGRQLSGRILGYSHSARPCVTEELGERGQLHI